MEEPVVVAKNGVVLKLIDMISEISAITDYRYTVRKQFFNLSRRLKLLSPLFEEIRDIKDSISDESYKSLLLLMEDLLSAKELLILGSEASKIYLVHFHYLHLDVLICIVFAFFG